MKQHLYTLYNYLLRLLCLLQVKLSCQEQHFIQRIGNQRLQLCLLWPQHLGSKTWDVIFGRYFSRCIPKLGDPPDFQPLLEGLYIYICIHFFFVGGFPEFAGTIVSFGSNWSNHLLQNFHSSFCLVSQKDSQSFLKLHAFTKSTSFWVFLLRQRR